VGGVITHQHAQVLDEHGRVDRRALRDRHHQRATVMGPPIRGAGQHRPSSMGFGTLPPHVAGPQAGPARWAMPVCLRNCRPRFVAAGRNPLFKPACMSSARRCMNVRSAALTMMSRWADLEVHRPFHQFPARFTLFFTAINVVKRAREICVPSPRRRPRDTRGHHLFEQPPSSARMPD